MTDPQAAESQDDAPAPVDRAPAQAFLQLRDTVKWLMTVSAALAAVLIAGLQLKDFSSVFDSDDQTRKLVVICSGAIALTLTLSLTIFCARILATPRLSINDLAARELAAGGSRADPRLEPSKDRLVQSILERRTYLLDGSPSISEFYSHYKTSREAQTRPHDGPTSTSPATAPRGAGRAEQAAERLEDWAQFLDASRRFSALTRWWFWVGGLLFATAVATLTVATQKTDQSLSIDSPTPVTIYLRDAPNRSGLPSSCEAEELQGVAIGGTYINPIITIEEPATCGPVTISPPAGSVVLLPD